MKKLSKLFILSLIGLFLSCATGEEGITYSTVTDEVHAAYADIKAVLNTPRRDIYVGTNSGEGWEASNTGYTEEVLTALIESKEDFSSTRTSIVTYTNYSGKINGSSTLTHTYSYESATDITTYSILYSAEMTIQNGELIDTVSFIFTYDESGEFNPSVPHTKTTSGTFTLNGDNYRVSDLEAHGPTEMITG